MELESAKGNFSQALRTRGVKASYGFLHMDHRVLFLYVLHYFWCCQSQSNSDNRKQAIAYAIREIPTLSIHKAL